MIRALLDTNIIIPHLDGRETLTEEDLSFCGLSALVVFELFRLPGVSIDEDKKIKKIISLCDVLSVDAVIAERAALLNRSRPRKHRVDLLIAATALEYGVPLITKNIKDFKNIPGLEVRSTL